MRALVTGPRGFLASHLLKALPPEWTVETLDRGDNIPDDIAAGHSRYDVVFHLAGKVDTAQSVTFPNKDRFSNAELTCDLARSIPCKHFLYVSTGAVYEGNTGCVGPETVCHPSLPYAAHKLLGESYVRCAVERWHTAEKATLVRFFGAYGPGDKPTRLLSRAVHRFAVERHPTFECKGDGQNLIDPMWIDDAVQGLIVLAETRCAIPKPVWTVDFCGGQARSVREVLTMTAHVFHVAPELHFTGSVAEHHQFHASNATWAKVLHHTPTVPLAEGLRRTAALVPHAEAA